MSHGAELRSYESISASCAVGPDLFIASVVEGTDIFSETFGVVVFHVGMHGANLVARETVHGEGPAASRAHVLVQEAAEAKRVHYLEIGKQWASRPRPNSDVVDDQLDPEREDLTAYLMIEGGFEPHTLAGKTIEELKRKAEGIRSLAPRVEP